MNNKSLIPMTIIGGLFFLFGFVTWLNGSLIPFLQIACELNHTQAYLVTMSFYIAYTVTALPLSVVLRRLGYKRGMSVGLIIMAAGSLLFIPAAETRMFSVFLLALFALGSGLTVLQTAANPYVVHIGPRDTAAVRISIMGLMNKGAGVIAPLVFTALVLGDMGQFDEAQLALLSAEERAARLDDLTARLIIPYLVMAGWLVALAVMVRFSPLPEIDLDNEAGNAADGTATERSSVLKFPQLVLGVAALFFYVGAEVVAGDTIGLFGKELGVDNFGQLTSYTMGFMVLGYILGMVAIPRWVSQERALAMSAVLGLILCVLILISGRDQSGIAGLLFFWTETSMPNVVFYVALMGLANALVWPAIWPLALRGLGKHTSAASALLIMAISGGAILPMIYGVIADLGGDSKSAYAVLLPCYAFILFYALKGCKLTHWRHSGELLQQS